MGHFKQALSDIQKANKADTANPETQARSLLLPLRDEPPHRFVISALFAQCAPTSRVLITCRLCIAHVHVL